MIKVSRMNHVGDHRLNKCPDYRTRYCHLIGDRGRRTVFQQGIPLPAGRQQLNRDALYPRIMLLFRRAQVVFIHVLHRLFTRGENKAQRLRYPAKASALLPRD